MPNKYIARIKKAVSPFVTWWSPLETAEEKAGSADDERIKAPQFAERTLIDKIQRMAYHNGELKTAQG